MKAKTATFDRHDFDHGVVFTLVEPMGEPCALTLHDMQCRVVVLKHLLRSGPEFIVLSANRTRPSPPPAEPSMQPAKAAPVVVRRASSVFVPGVVLAMNDRTQRAVVQTAQGFVLRGHRVRDIPLELAPPQMAERLLEYERQGYRVTAKGKRFLTEQVGAGRQTVDWGKMAILSG